MVRKLGFISLSKYGNHKIVNRIISYDLCLREIAFHSRKLLHTFHLWTQFLLQLWNHILFHILFFPLSLSVYILNKRFYSLGGKKKEGKEEIEKEIERVTRQIFKSFLGFAFCFFFLKTQYFFHISFTSIDSSCIEQKNMQERQKASSRW